MNTYRKYLLLLMTLAGLSSCSEEIVNEPIIYSNEAPAALTDNDLKIRSIGGGAVIHYELPNRDEVRAVEARCQLTTGEIIKVRSSVLSDSILVEGYIDTNPHTVELYVVSRSEVYSPAKTITIQPQKAPLIKVIESLDVKEDFGGMVINWKNEDQVPVAIYVSQVQGQDTIDVSAYYSKTAKGAFAVRGLESKEGHFLFQVRDKFQNYSKYEERKLTPLFEKELNYKGFKIMPNLYFKNVKDYTGMTTWWDGKTPDYFWPTDSETPWYGSVDMDKTTKLSRFIIWQYGWSFNDFGHFYSGANARIYKIYGSNEPATNGGMDGWNLIMTCEIKLPSGNPINNFRDGMTDEDYDVAKNKGHEFVVPLETPRYRYLRIECIKNFDGGIELGSSSEFQFFGDDR